MLQARLQLESQRRILLENKIATLEAEKSWFKGKEYGGGGGRGQIPDWIASLNKSEHNPTSPHKINNSNNSKSTTSREEDEKIVSRPLIDLIQSPEDGNSSGVAENDLQVMSLSSMVSSNYTNYKEKIQRVSGRRTLSSRESLPAPLTRINSAHAVNNLSRSPPPFFSSPTPISKYQYV